MVLNRYRGMEVSTVAPVILKLSDLDNILEVIGQNQ